MAAALEGFILFRGTNQPKSGCAIINSSRKKKRHFFYAVYERWARVKTRDAIWRFLVLRKLSLPSTVPAPTPENLEVLLEACEGPTAISEKIVLIGQRFSERSAWSLNT